LPKGIVDGSKFETHLVDVLLFGFLGGSHMEGLGPWRRRDARMTRGIVWLASDLFSNYPHASVQFRATLSRAVIPDRTVDDRGKTACVVRPKLFLIV
jgi:hypothetical protein